MATPAIKAAADAMWWRIVRAMQGSKAWPAVFQAGSARALTRATLEALKEPDESMLLAGLQVSRSSDYRADDSIGGAVFRAMIRRAIEDLDRAEGRTTPLTADCTNILPGGRLDVSTFEQIEDALDRAEAPCRDANGKWLTLPERISAMAVNR